MQDIQHFFVDFKSKYQEEISTISSDLHFVLVFPYHCFLKNEPAYKQIYPVILTFRNDTQTIQKLIDKFQKQQPKESQFKNGQFEFTLSRGHVLNRQLTFRQIKINFRNKNLDGLPIYITKHAEIDPMDDPELFHQDQCCLTTYFFDDLKGDNNDDLLIKIKVPSQNNQFLYISISPKKSIQTLKQKFIAKTKQVYGQSLQEKDFKFVFNNLEIEQDFLCQTIQYKENDLQLQIEACLTKNKKLIRIVDKSKTLTIHGQHLKQPVKLIYDEYRNYPFHKLYEQKLKPQMEKVEKSMEYSLKIMDQIIRPNQLLSKIAFFFEAKKDQAQKYNVVAKIIHQKVIFYDQIYKLTEEKPFTFEDMFANMNLKISEDQRQKIDTKISKIAQKAQQEFFKDKKNLEPIFLYTSSIKYLDNQKKQQFLLYNGINKFLSSQTFSITTQKDLQKWQYQYTSHFLNKLKKVQNPKVKQKQQWVQVWRGVTYDIEFEPKEKMLLKSFNSTSRKRKVAQGFARRGNGIHSLWKMKIKFGKDIKHFSNYLSEEQILILPYSQFQIIKKQIEGDLLIYEMKEIEFKKEIPQTKINFILWVDDKVAEGKKIFQRVDCDTETTVLVQLLSTDQLQKWLTKHHNIIEDKTANIIFITNMTRKQKVGDNIVTNATAGIDGIKKLRDKYSQIPIFVYIGNLELSREKLVKGGIDLNTVKISKFSKDIIQFIIVNCKNVNKKENLYESAPPGNQSDHNNPQSYSSFKKKGQSQLA